MLELAPGAFSFTLAGSLPLLKYVKAGLELRWDETVFQQKYQMSEADFETDRESIEPLLSLYQEIFMHCTDMDNAWRRDFDVLRLVLQREADTARQHYGYIIDLLKKLQQNAEHGDKASGQDTVYLKRQLDSMVTSKSQATDETIKHANGLLAALATFEEVSEPDEQDVDLKRQQFTAYGGLSHAVSSYARVHHDLVNLQSQKSGIADTVQPFKTSIQQAHGAWQALADDIVILSKEETHAFSHYQALLSKLDLERIVKTRQELAHEVQSFNVMLQNAIGG